MNKKTITLIISAAIIIALSVAGWFIYSFATSFHKVTITLSEHVTTAALYKADPNHNDEAPTTEGDKLQDITSTTELSLQKGEYFIIPQGDKILKGGIDFAVGDSDTTVHVDPDFSEDYLKDQLSREESAIQSVINTSFPGTMPEYTIHKGTLYKKGDWYGALLKRKVTDPRDEHDIYRVAVHKQAGQWKVIKRPEIVLTSAEFKEVPVEILRSLNEQGL